MEKTFEFVVDYQERVLPNGLTVIAAQRPQAQWQEMLICVRSGAKDDPVGLEGLAHMVEHQLLREAGMTAVEFEDFFKNLYGEAEAGSTGMFFTSWRFMLPKESFELGVDLSARLLFSPKWNCTDFFFQEKEAVLREFYEKEKLPLQKALKQVNALLFPNSVVERHDRPLGTLVGIKSISLADLVKFHLQHYQPSNLVLFAEGGFSADELVEILGKSQFGQGTEVGWQNPLLVSEPVFHAPKFSRFEYRGNDWGFPEIGKKEVYLRGLVPVNKSPVPNFLLGAISNYAFKSLRVEQGLVYSTNQEFTSHFPAANQFTFGAVLGVAVDVDVVSQVWDDFLHWLETQECEDFVQKQQQQFLAKARFPEYYNWSYPQLSTIADNYFYSIPLSELSREAGIARWKNLKMEDVRAYIPYLQKYVMMIGHF